jgi:membrane-associated protease RseP (regulator of RpoE activity)
MGVYISRVEEGSVAERAGLRPGDTILEVNGTPFRAVTHEEALKVSLAFCLLSRSSEIIALSSVLPRSHSIPNIAAAIFGLLPED